jgi:hypothetical protein
MAARVGTRQKAVNQKFHKNEQNKSHFFRGRRVIVEGPRKRYFTAKLALRLSA